MSDQERQELRGVGSWVVAAFFALVALAFWLVPYAVGDKPTTTDKVISVLLLFVVFAVKDFVILHRFLEAVGDLAVKAKEVLAALITRKAPT